MYESIVYKNINGTPKRELVNNEEYGLTIGTSSTTEEATLALMTWNSNSLGNIKNQQKVIDKVRKLQDNIVVLCDTCLSKEQEALLSRIWG